MGRREILVITGAIIIATVAGFFAGFVVCEDFFCQSEVIETSEAETFEVDFIPCSEGGYDFGGETIIFKDDYIVTVKALTSPINRVIECWCPICDDHNWLTVPFEQTKGIVECRECGAQLEWEVMEIDGVK